MSTPTREISNLIVMGNWGAGKTQFILRLWHLLEREQGIADVILRSDRLAFEEEVFKDTRGGTKTSEGYIIGNHSILEKLGEPGKSEFKLLDGTLGNLAHVKMLDELKEVNPGVTRVVEYATGPTTAAREGITLDQSAHFVVERTRNSGALKHTLLIELHAPYAERHSRNPDRIDPVAEDAFIIYGQEGGNIGLLDRWILGDHFLPINNSRTDLDRLVQRVYFDTIQRRLMLDENIYSKEGRPASAMRRDRR